MKLSPTNYLVSLFIVTFLAITFLNLLATPALAQDATESSSLDGQAVTSSNYKAPQNADYALTNFMHGGLCILGGFSPAGDCVANEKQSDGSIKLKAYSTVPNGGAIGSIVSGIAYLYQSPTSTGEYIADIGRNLGLVKSAYAQNVQGSGESIVKPIKSLYLFVQKIAFILYTLVFVIVGFMIMFRRKMNQQTVVNIQNALPKLVVGLLLITFSYFISSLIVDLAFIGIQIVAAIFISNIATVPNGLGDAAVIDGLAKNSNILTLYGTSINQGLKDQFWNLVGGSFETVKSAFVTPFVGPQGGGFAKTIVTMMNAQQIAGGLLISGATSFIVSLLLPLVLIVALTIQFFRLFMSLLNSYITILVSTLLSPLIILYASIPGQGGKMDLWWKNLLAHSLVFPAIFLGFLFAGVILGDTSAWTAAPPFFGGLDTRLLQLIVAYGILLGLPAIPKMVTDALGVKPLQGIPQAAMGAALGGFGIARKSANAGTSRLFKPYTEGAKKYREANANRMLGLDRFNEAQSIASSRLRAAESNTPSGYWNRLANRVFYRMNPDTPKAQAPNRYYQWKAEKSGNTMDPGQWITNRNNGYAAYLATNPTPRLNIDDWGMQNGF